MIDYTGEGVVDARPEALFATVADLATYPDWLGIVHRASAVEAGVWLVDIGARLGPFRRAKRLRMARVECDPPWAVRFERQEADGAEHSPWVLAASLAPAGDGAGTALAVRLFYGGGLPLPGLDRVLAQEVRRALPRLARRAH